MAYCKEHREVSLDKRCDSVVVFGGLEHYEVVIAIVQLGTMPAKDRIYAVCCSVQSR
jgi:hypothetical protein